MCGHTVSQMSDLPVSAYEQPGVAQDNRIPDLVSEQSAGLDQQHGLSPASSVASQPDLPEPPHSDSEMLKAAEDVPLLTRTASSEANSEAHTQSGSSTPHTGSVHSSSKALHSTAQHSQNTDPSQLSDSDLGLVSNEVLSSSTGQRTSSIATSQASESESGLADNLASAPSLSANSEQASDNAAESTYHGQKDRIGSHAATSTSSVVPQDTSRGKPQLQGDSFVMLY